MNRVDFLLDADELSLVIKALQDALTRRPNPEGEPHFELQTALDSFDEYFESVRKLTEAIGKLSAHDLLRMLQSLTEAESEDYLGEPLITLDAEEELNCFNTWLMVWHPIRELDYGLRKAVVLVPWQPPSCWDGGSGGINSQVPFPPSGAWHRISAGPDQD
ncbi:MAG: hypothetical protein GXX84_17130 [Acidobacteria bacterium]|nr:hypothetical protein [Acidobacteriota bacterium]